MILKLLDSKKDFFLDKYNYVEKILNKYNYFDGKPNNPSIKSFKKTGKNIRQPEYKIIIDSFKYACDCTKH